MRIGGMSMKRKLKSCSVTFFLGTFAIVSIICNIVRIEYANILLSLNPILDVLYILDAVKTSYWLRKFQTHSKLMLREKTLIWMAVIEKVIKVKKTCSSFTIY